ncbi:MAG: hypothetical protein EPO51_11590 [Phenylobacterium sp.]|uniref:hypothetical protein n=1 Tax=Phenylobacterium sp. TaxID=1871053 RepID=UPI001226A4CC|nr:hypothetical protein [Phenylobacterium sp.]TAJ71761.1 MAG: hypothetical protein EPO51_11590 [Phenylobacterium sp.]
MSGRESVNPASPGPGVRLAALGWSLSIFLLLTFLLCAALGYLLPAGTPHLLVGAVWRAPSNVALGAAAAFALGWYAALVAGGLYNHFRGPR